MTQDMRAVVVILDGFRRDFMDPYLTPTIWTLAQEGCDFPKSRAVFPSATRVNSAAISTGTLPAIHGLVANKYVDAQVFTDRAIDTSRIDHLHAVAKAHGTLLTAPTLGARLAASGRRLAVVTTGSEGTTHLANPGAAEFGHLTLSVKEWQTSTPREMADEALATCGEVPPLARPNSARSRYLTDLFLEFVEPRLAPDVALLWYNDPDVTLHRHGPGTPECREALRSLDKELGRLVAWRRDAGLEGRVQFIIASDHGHVTGLHPVDLPATFADAGFPVASRSDSGARFVGVLGYYGLISETSAAKSGLPDLAAWLMRQPWCGAVFTRGGDGREGGIPGTLAMSLLGGEHPRFPDLYFCLQGDDTPNAHGFPGCVFYDGGQAVGGGLHGGLNRRELANLLVLNGSRFRRGFSSPLHAGDIDIAPTVLDLFGIPPTTQMRGRVLAEAWTTRESAPLDEPGTVSVRAGDRLQTLGFARVGRGIYLDGVEVTGN